MTPPGPRTFDLADLFEVVPKEFHVLDAVQRTPAGKPDHRWAKTRAVELSA